MHSALQYNLHLECLMDFLCLSYPHVYYRHRHQSVAAAAAEDEAKALDRAEDEVEALDRAAVVVVVVAVVPGLEFGKHLELEPHSCPIVLVAPLTTQLLLKM